jgi:death-on-curing protein
MKFNYQSIIIAHKVIAHNNIIAVHFNENVLKGITEAMDKSFSGIYLHKDIYEKGSILFEHIIRLHPFLDGNKRTAMFSLILYLASECIFFVSFPSDVRFAVMIAKIQVNTEDEINVLIKNIDRWIHFHCAKVNNKKEIKGLILRNIGILEKVKNISIQRNNPDILSRSVNNWRATEVYPDIDRKYEDFIVELNKLMELVNKI